MELYCHDTRENMPKDANDRELGVVLIVTCKSTEVIDIQIEQLRYPIVRNNIRIWTSTKGTCVPNAKRIADLKKREEERQRVKKDTKRDGQSPDGEQSSAIFDPMQCSDMDISSEEDEMEEMQVHVAALLLTSISLPDVDPDSKGIMRDFSWYRPSRHG